MEAFDCTGIWWLPGDSSEKIGGTLHFSDEKGIELSLIGAFGTPPVGLGKKVPVIHGLAWDFPNPGPLTLEDCLVQSYSVGSEAIAREKYDVGRVFIGSHLKPEDISNFFKVSFSFSGLPDWASQLTGLSYNLPKNQDHRAIEIKWESPAEIVGEIRGERIVLGTGATTAFHRRHWTIDEKIRFTVTLREPMSFKELNSRYIYPLQNFLTLATDHPNALLDCAVHRHQRERPTNVVFKRSFHDTECASDLAPHDMLFALSDVRDRVMELINRWLEVSERLEAICESFFSILYQPRLFLEPKFLRVFYALKAYQRDRSKATAKGESSDESPPVDPLAELVEEHANTVGNLFKGDSSTADAEWIQYRNHIVNLSGDIPGGDAYGERLFWLTERLIFLMKACLLTEMGFSGEEQSKLFNRNADYVHLMGMRR